MKKLDTKKIAILGMTAAIYVALTMSLSSLSYMNVQFRVAEALVLLCFYRKEYCWSMIVACAIANIASFSIVDVVFGTLATALAVWCITRCKNIYVASLFPVVVNAVIVGIELKVFMGLPLFLSMAQVALGEFVCVSILGVAMFKLLEKNKKFMSVICFGEASQKVAGK